MHCIHVEAMLESVITHRKAPLVRLAPACSCRNSAVIIYRTDRGDDKELASRHSRWCSNILVATMPRPEARADDSIYIASAVLAPFQHMPCLLAGGS